MQIAFRALQASDARALDDAQRIMAQEDFAFAFDYVPGQDFGAYLAQLEEGRLGRNLPPDEYALPTNPATPRPTLPCQCAATGS